MTDTRNILIRFEVAEDMTPEQLHEGLCLVIHECHPAVDYLTGMTHDIEVQKLSIAEAVDLGLALGSFSTNQIDQGIHAVLPGIINAGESDEREENMVFDSLCKQFLGIDVSQVDYELLGQAYIDVVVVWAKDNNIEIGR